MNLSNLNPKRFGDDLSKSGSFFGHLHASWKLGFDITARIVVFGGIRPEMNDEGKTFTRKDCSGRRWSSNTATLMVSASGLEGDCLLSRPMNPL